jgi:MFS family permease
MALVRSLTFQPFLLLWSGQSISRLGDSFYRIALGWWVLEKTGSATIMGTVFVVSFTPMLIFLLLGGVVVDRFSRLRVMLASDLVRGVVTAVIAYFAFANQLEVWHIFIASAIFGFGDAFFQPAYTAAIPEITPKEFLPSANSITSLSRQIAEIAGPALGAFIIGAGGTSTAFAFNSFSFFISAACLLPIVNLTTPPPAPTQQSSALHDLREGFQTVLASEWLWLTILIAAFGNVAMGGIINVAAPFLVNDILKVGVAGLGAISTARAAGALLTAFWLGRLTRLNGRGKKAYLGLVISGLMLIFISFQQSIVGVVLASAVYGASLTVFDLVWTNTLQELVPAQKLGRVFSIDALGSFALLPIGYGAVGWATDLLGPRLMFLLGGLTALLINLIGLSRRAIRTLE